MELLFFGGRHRYPGEVVPWSEYFGEWLEHPILAALALFCMIWMLSRMYGVWKMQREEKLFPYNVPSKLSLLHLYQV